MSKEESVETAPAKPATPPPKPAAAKAAAAPASSKTAVPRRSLLSWVTLAWVAFTASMLASLTATARNGVGRQSSMKREQLPLLLQPAWAAAWPALRERFRLTLLYSLESPKAYELNN